MHVMGWLFVSIFKTLVQNYAIFHSRCHWRSSMSEMELFREGHVQTPSQPAASPVSESSSVECQALSMNVRLCVMKVLVHHVLWRLQSNAGVVPWIVMSCVLNWQQKQMKPLAKSHVKRSATTLHVLLCNADYVTLKICFLLCFGKHVLIFKINKWIIVICVSI